MHQLSPLRLSPRGALLVIGFFTVLSLGAQCGEGTAPSTPRLVLSMGNGDGQSAVIGTEVGTPPSVIVTDTNGNAVAGVSVTFAVTYGGGVLEGNVQTTNDAGVATVGKWALGKFGRNKIAATSENTTGGPIVFTAMATAGPPAEIVLMTPISQDLLLGNPVTTPPSVKVTDASDDPVAGVVVNFADPDSGVVSGATQTTNALGIATVGGWTPGHYGSNVLTVNAAGISTGVFFVAVANIGAAAKVAVQTQPAGATDGLGFATQPVVKVTDTQGNVVANVPLLVTASIADGSGTLAGTTTVTTYNGIARFTDLVILGTGAHTLRFAAAGLAPVLSDAFNVTPWSGGTKTLVATAPARVNLGDLFSITVEARDESGNLITDFRNTIATTMTLGTGTLTGTTAAVAENGSATLRPGIIGRGAHTLTLSAPGAVPASVTLQVDGPILQEIQKNAGDLQGGMAGQTVVIRPSVRVVAAGGLSAAGVTVTFAVTSGGGSITGGTAVTDAYGLATVGGWTLGAAPGHNALTATVSEQVTTGNVVTFDAAGCSDAGPGFKINVCFMTEMTASEKAAFTSAAAKWESIITGDQPAVTYSATLSAGACGLSTGSIPAGTQIDDLLIFAAVTRLDGPSGVLATAGPCQLRSSNDLPVIGSMQLDGSDIEGLDADGSLSQVVLHEMGHVLGIGTLWDGFGRHLLVNPSSAGHALDTYYSGANGIAGFNAIGGSSYPGPKVPVENVGGAGTANAHWRESVLKSELMTGILGPGNPDPLSLLTVRSLKDLGYTVDEAKADPFSIALPVASVRGTFRTIDLRGDVSTGPVVVVDGLGRIVRRLR